MAHRAPRHSATPRTNGVTTQRPSTSQTGKTRGYEGKRFASQPAPTSAHAPQAPRQASAPVASPSAASPRQPSSPASPRPEDSPYQPSFPFAQRPQGSAREPSAAFVPPSLPGSPEAQAGSGTPAGQAPLRQSRHERARLIAAKRQVNRYQNVGVGIVGVVLVAGLICGGLYFLRPQVSQVEHRQLTEFPQISFGSFMDGSYFADIALWYADTYPLRDPLVGFDQTLQALYGFSGDAKMVGGNVVADELPVVSKTQEDQSQSAGDSSAQSQEAPVEDQKAAPESKTHREVNPPDPGALQQEMQNQIMNGLYVKDGTAYNLYWFSDEATRAYVDAINLAADRLEGTSQVYSLLTPTNAGVLLDDELYSSLGGTNQGQAIDYFYSLMDSNVIGVPAFEALREHKDEYIYFRTDHHWTNLGAYYGYQAFCEQKGIEPEDRNTMDSMTFEGFLGSFYGELLDSQMAANPDTIVATIPKSTNDLTYWDDTGEYHANVINDVTGWDPSGLSMTFIMGDQNLQKVDNPNINDGSSVLLIKDSYGCAFAPWLVDHYDTTYIIDYRAYDGNFVDFALENDIDDVIFLNNISLAGTFGTADMIMSKVAD